MRQGGANGEGGMRMRFDRLAMLAVAATLAAGNASAAPNHSGKSSNPADDALMKLPPPQQAARLARAISQWCIGTQAFQMGVISAGKGAGNAYWSLRCADGTTWAVQIDPLAVVTAIDCASFKEQGAGKECFKKF
jgi:hypothetical protein